MDLNVIIGFYVAVLNFKFFKIFLDIFVYHIPLDSYFKKLHSEDSI